MTASLAPRGPAAHGRPVLASRLLVGGALLAGAALAVAGRGPGTLAVAVVGAAVVLVAEVTRDRVVGRRRPVLPLRAARLDARMRAFALRSVALLELAAAVLTLTWVVGVQPDTGPGVLDALLAVVAVTGLVLSVVLLRRAVPRPPRRWRPPAPDGDPAPPAAAPVGQEGR